VLLLLLLLFRIWYCRWHCRNHDCGVLAGIDPNILKEQLVGPFWNVVEQT
jgi:hypothetical protein